MPRIELTTIIEADINVVFDLSRSIDLHKISTKHTNEEAIAGRTSGLIELGETVTWRAKHFGIYQKLTSVITEFNRPNSFVDEMVHGAFKWFRHDHHFSFSQTSGKTIMKDVFEYESPLGFLGRIVDDLFLENYMRNLLEIRNQTIKEFSESGRWKKLLEIDS
ncbi:MAG: cell division protein [Flavobacteriales bacterium]|nr:cell division protein [Flavobacteriales bacterium]